MSVIVFDGTTLAADSHANNGDLAFPYPKIWEVASTNGQSTTNRFIAGAVGPLQQVAQLQQWVLDGLIPQQFASNCPDAQLVVVTKEKGLTRYRGSAIPYLHGHNKIAIGEGAPFAYGALYMGATAEQAVAAAIEYSPHCSGQPVTLTL